MDFTPLKTQLAKSFLCVATSRPAAAPVPPGTRRPPLPPLFPGGGERRPRGPRAPPRARRRPHLQSRVCPTRTLSFASNFVFFFCCFVSFLFCFRHTQDGTETQTPPPPPIVSYCSFSARRSAERWKTESWKSLCSQVHGSTWLLAPLSSFCNTQMVSLASSLHASASPVAGECSLPARTGCLPAAAAGWKGDAPRPAARRSCRQSGSEGRAVKKVQFFFFLLFCFLPIAASSSSDQGFISKR